SILRVLPVVRRRRGRLPVGGAPARPYPLARGSVMIHLFAASASSGLAGLAADLREFLAAIRFARPESLWLLLLLPILGLVNRWATRRRRAAVGRIGRPAAVEGNSRTRFSVAAGWGWHIRWGGSRSSWGWPARAGARVTRPASRSVAMSSSL